MVNSKHSQNYQNSFSPSNDLPVHPKLADLLHGEQMTYAPSKPKNKKLENDNLYSLQQNPYLQHRKSGKKSSSFPAATSKHPGVKKRPLIGFLPPEETKETQKEDLSSLIAQIARIAEEEGVDVLAETGTVETPNEDDETTPWWDAPYVNGLTDSLVDDQLEWLLFDDDKNEENHKKSIDPPIKLLPTPAEQRRDRRDRRLAMQRDQQDLIRAGLAQPPPDRLKLSGVARMQAALATKASSSASGGTAALNSTELELRIKQDVEARKAEHLRTNLARSLTPAERAAKKRDKLKAQGRADPDGAIHACIIRLDLQHNGQEKDTLHQNSLTLQQQYKIVSNARQRYLGGVLLVHPSYSPLVYLEGGLKAIGQLKHLIKDRMPLQTSSGDQMPFTADVCWEGTIPVKHPSLSSFEHLQAQSVFEMRTFLQERLGDDALWSVHFKPF